MRYGGFSLLKSGLTKIWPFTSICTKGKKGQINKNISLMDHRLVTVYDCDIIQGILILNEIN